MASCWISQYSGVGPGDIQAPLEPVVAATQKIAVGSETDTTALDANARLVRLATDTACHFVFGTAPTATTGDEYLAAGADTYRWVQAGAGTMKVSVIAAA